MEKSCGVHVALANKGRVLHVVRKLGDPPLNPNPDGPGLGGVALLDELEHGQESVVHCRRRCSHEPCRITLWLWNTARSRLSIFKGFERPAVAVEQLVIISVQ